MIKQYKILLAPQRENCAPFTAGAAYTFYGALMQKLTPECAEQMHSADEINLTQYLTPVSGGAKALWTVSLLSKEKNTEAASILEDCNEYRLISRDTVMKVEERASVVVDSLGELLDIPGGDRDCARFHMRFISPTAFRVAGEYQFFPTVKHILASLSSRWNAAFPASPVEDCDAFTALEKGVRITGYDLRSSYYRLKGTPIPAFTGWATLSAKLSPPLLQLLRGLLAFGCFGGIGIKTALGMGGTAIKESPRSTKNV